MFLNLSPLATHLNESLCSLRFATKVSSACASLRLCVLMCAFQVNNTTIGTAKKQAKQIA